MFNTKGVQANRTIHRSNQLLAHLKFIILKIPSFILYWISFTTKSTPNSFSSYIFYFIYKFVLVLSLLVCSQQQVCHQAVRGYGNGIQTHTHPSRLLYSAKFAPNCFVTLFYKPQRRFWSRAISTLMQPATNST